MRFNHRSHPPNAKIRNLLRLNAGPNKSHRTKTSARSADIRLFLVRSGAGSPAPEQNRDRYEAALRREMLVSMILEMHIRENQIGVTNDLMRGINMMFAPPF